MKYRMFKDNIGISTVNLPSNPLKGRNRSTYTVSLTAI